MSEKKKIRFIANPRSGSVRNRNLPQLLADNLDHGLFEHELCLTERAGHAVELAREGVALGFDLVVAVGGDGSVNEVASQLIGTQTVLGVVPCGSGNGFAGHLGLGRDVAKAIRTLNDGLPITVDTCTLNGQPFVNLAGVGFDGTVAKRLHDSPVRGFWAYLRYTLEETLRYESQLLDIQIDGEKIQRKCLLVEVANAPIYGYGFSIVPQANFTDGKLEVLLIHDAPKWRYVLESWRFLNRSFHKSPLAECYTGREVVIAPAKPIGAHMDGEGFQLTGEARFGIRPASLRVLVPKVYAEILKR
ncbi:MAG: diacylglycerol kinase family lipid kinase [Saprospiraceae bacterium]|jgi:YegS/Rv2252/BmrU family lipid kinase|nr:diacylglycerol kinase family lipid kinase [Saprospiraceae bacterium]